MPSCQFAHILTTNHMEVTEIRSADNTMDFSFCFDQLARIGV